MQWAICSHQKEACVQGLVLLHRLKADFMQTPCASPRARKPLPQVTSELTTLRWGTEECLWPTEVCNSSGGVVYPQLYLQFPTEKQKKKDSNDHSPKLCWPVEGGREAHHPLTGISFHGSREGSITAFSLVLAKCFRRSTCIAAREF